MLKYIRLDNAQGNHFGFFGLSDWRHIDDLYGCCVPESPLRRAACIHAEPALFGEKFSDVVRPRD